MVVGIQKLLDGADQVKLLESIMKSKPPIIWLNILVFSITFVIAIIGVPIYAFYEGFNIGVIISAVFVFCFSTFSITAGYHRLWSHKAYEANGVIRFLFAIGGAFAIQNSALHWSSDHRIHHTHVDDNDKDPYSAKRGFWYSHIGWILREYQAHRYNNYDNVKDLKKDNIVMWQHKHYLFLVLVTNFGIPIILGAIFNQVLGGLLLIGFMRLVVSHHTTFFINSLAHIWGSQPYSDKNTAKDNPILAIFTFGEGYHNFHHAFQYDYRNAIKWWQFDPTKWLIKFLSLVGLAKNLRKIPEVKIAKAIAAQQLNRTMKRLKCLPIPNKEEVIQSIQAEYEQTLFRMKEFYAVKREWIDMQKNQVKENISLYQVKFKYRESKGNWIHQKRHWNQLISQFA